MEVDDTTPTTPDGHEVRDNVTTPREAETDADGWIEVTRRKKNRDARRDNEPSPQRETRRAAGK
ncbi:hypothetical protein MTO96_044691, partial [Rhipicephalus appendiculatus]